MSLKSIQQQISKKPGKSAVLGVLLVVLVVLVIKGMDQMSPKKAAAMMPAVRADAAPGATREAGDIDLERKTRASQALWAILRDQRGLTADAAFRFDPTYYNLDPSKIRDHQLPPERIVVVPNKSDSQLTDQQSMRAREAHVRELARMFTLQTTILGPDPKALISVNGNSQLVHVGDSLNGFKIIAIESRAVEVENDNVNVSLKMGSESRP